MTAKDSPSKRGEEGCPFCAELQCVDFSKCGETGRNQLMKLEQKRVECFIKHLPKGPPSKPGRRYTASDVDW